MMPKGKGFQVNQIVGILKIAIGIKVTNLLLPSIWAYFQFLPISLFMILMTIN